jgi:hypothetical protein
MSYTMNFEASRYQHFLLHNWEGCQISAWRQVKFTEVLCGFPYSLHAGFGILPHNPTICMEGLSQHSVASIQSRLWTGQPGFWFLVKASFIYSRMSRQALGPAQSHSQSVPGFLSPGVKWPRCEVDHSPTTSVKDKNKWCYTFTPLGQTLLSLTTEHKSWLFPSTSLQIIQQPVVNRI